MQLSNLQSIGLSEKAAKIYLSALSLGTASIQNIAKKAEIKRPTAYIYVEELVKDGLLEKYPSGKKDIYKATDPAILEKRIERQLQEAKNLIPELQLIKNQMSGNPKISFLEGQSGIRMIYDEMCNANQIRFWSDLKSVEKNFQDMFLKIAESINTNEIRAREILANTDDAKKSSKHFSSVAGKSYSSKLATKSPGIFNDNAIYDDIVVIFKIQGQNVFVIRIEEKAIADTMKTMFDMAWDSATPFIGR